VHNSHELKYVVLPARNVPLNALDLHNSAFSLWHKVWGDFWKERQQPQLLSDTFVRQDEVSAIFHKEECVGLCLLANHNLDLVAYRNDSYFSKVWPPSTHGILEKLGKNIIAGSHITTAENWRRGNHGISMKELVIAMAILRFLNSKEDAMIGAMRKNRNVHQAAYKFGAQYLDSYHHEGTDLDIDLVIFERQNSKVDPQSELGKLAHDLWNNRIRLDWKDAQENRAAAA